MSAQFFKQKFKEFTISAPSIHFVLGSGLSSAFENLSSQSSWEPCGTLKFSEVPNISSATAPGHAGVFRYFKHKKTGNSICFQVGRLHGYEGLEPRDVVQPLTSAFQAGTKKFILTNASGSLTPDFKPGSVMIIRDHVNFTGKNPLFGHNQVGESGALLGPRFPDMTTAWDKTLGDHLAAALKSQGITTHEGNYLGCLGPSYETPAEVRLFHSWGLHAVGMSTVWEALQLRYMGATFSGCSFISNLGAGLTGQALDHTEVEAEGKKIAALLVKALFHFAENEAEFKA